ncbi:MAG TPA: carboxypeptidase-like regulatory domain-containing protein, partial [Flavisolibacter sp.]|nr:carboxypeptidase-like regulatory domain-containing protein [Flavisolibacter sp.]
MKGTLLTGILACLTCLASFGQTKYIKLSGKVTDVVNGSPLVGASVIVESTKAGVKTDVEGTFFITVPEGKKYNLLISNVGYQTKVVNDVDAS